MKTFSDPWIAPTQKKLPDFIIMGAMKAGTSTLHQILNQHPNVFIPDPEIHFFDIDDIFEHPDFFSFTNGEWITPDLEMNPARFWQWYSTFFDKAQDGQLIGEDSTVYLASEKAIKRISLQEKKIKLIVLLRHPTIRAYSQYLHLVRTGRATCTFEKMLQTQPHTLLKRSLYSDQVKMLFHYLPENRIKFVIFEEFLSNKERIIDEICDFLGLDYQLLPEGTTSMHANKTKTPKYFELQLLKNRLITGEAKSMYSSHLPMSPTVHHQRSKNGLIHVVNKIYQLINPSTKQKPKPMVRETQKFLDAFFQKELLGLDALIGKNVNSLWFG